MSKPTVFGGQSASRGHIGFAADDGLDACIVGFAIELDGPEHVAMVGHRDGRLARRFNLLDERFDLIRAVKETELCMEVEVDEGRSHEGILGAWERRSQTHEEEHMYRASMTLYLGDEQKYTNGGSRLSATIYLLCADDTSARSSIRQMAGTYLAGQDVTDHTRGD